MTARLTPKGFGRAVSRLIADDSDLAGIVERHGRPAFWRRPTGFPTLMLTILEQQVSLASARAAYERLLELVDGRLDADRFLRLDDRALRGAGFSRQKARYGRALAVAVKDGTVPLERLGAMTDDEARARLQRVVGIGRWTADVYLLAALRRPDVWPVGDLALVAAVKRVKGLATRPSPAAMADIGDAWRPFRSVAARLLWHEYLSAA